MAIALAMTGCMSMAAGLVKSQIKDYGSYDKSVPADQQAQLRFMFVKVKSFDGKSVDWEGSGANNFGKINVPAGQHELIFDWVMQDTKMTGSNYNSGTGSMTYTYTTTTKSKTNIAASLNMVAGHNYLLAGAQKEDGSLLIQIQDMTNMPSEIYGDTVADAPKANKTPTELEGSWKDSQGMTFEFTGNSWQQMIPPNTATNTGTSEVGIKGTFEIKDGIVTMYATYMYAAGKWIKTAAFKQAYIWSYSLDNGSLNMELPGILAKEAFTKQ
jgi:hypothetical protein